MKVTYVLPAVGPGGGPRVVYGHLAGLAARGHDAQLWTLGPCADTRFPSRVFASYDDLQRALSAEQGLKVATWWETAAVVLGSCDRWGTPVYLVQDMEAGYYSDSDMKSRVEATYTDEFHHYVTNGTWVADQLRERGRECEIVKPGIDSAFVGRPGNGREVGTVFAFARGEPMKNFAATVDAWRLLRDRRLMLAAVPGEGVAVPAGAECYRGLDDGEIAELYSRASVYLLTSRHEGYGLTILEAMACGCPVVTTECDGNRDFVRDGENCVIVPADDPVEIAGGVERVLSMSHGELDDMRTAGHVTAAEHDWTAAIDRLEAVYQEWYDE